MMTQRLQASPSAKHLTVRLAKGLWPCQIRCGACKCLQCVFRVSGGEENVVDFVLPLLS